VEAVVVNKDVASSHAASLSAILLDEAYYRCIQDGKIILDGISILSVEYIIPFKMRAFCDLSKSRALGFPVDTKNITKHKNDVLKIAQLLSPEQNVEVSEEIKQHMKEFMIVIQDEPLI